MRPQLLRRLGAEIERKRDSLGRVPAKDVSQVLGWAARAQAVAAAKRARRAEALGADAGERGRQRRGGSWPS